MKVKNGHHSKFPVQAIGTKKPEKIKTLMGFEPMTSTNTDAMIYQLSYEATHWEQGQCLPVSSEMM